MEKGKLIILEGTDFAGKTTCIKALKDDLESKSIKFVTTLEPGSGLKEGNFYDFCNDIRMKLLTEKYDSKVEAWMFATSRYFHTLDIINYLNNGYHVICDRFFISSLAYQAIKIGISNVYDYNKLALDLLKDYEVYNLIMTLDFDVYKTRSLLRENDVIENVSEKMIKLRIDNMKDAKTILSVLKMEKWKENTYFIDATQTKEKQIKECIETINKIINN